MQSTRERGLKVHAVLAHPVATGGGGANHQARQLFVGDATGDLEQILPIFFFGVSVDQHILRCIVHATQIACVA